jgi:hypothetical protein
MLQGQWRFSGLLVASLLLSTSSVNAKPAHKRALADYFGPYLAQKLNDCRTCHLPDPKGKDNEETEKKPHNAFGRRLAEVKGTLGKAGKKFDIPARLEAIAEEDSDGDGVANILELLSGHFPGDAKDKPTSAEIAAARRALAAFRVYRKARTWDPFEPVRRPALPKVKNAAWVRNPIDVFLAAEHERHSLTPRPPAAKRVLLRRLYLDLTGLPPTPAELRAFLADPSADAYQKVVDKLLASPRYGERWGRHWMDVWRYADWAGYGAEVRDSRKHIWHWRDWIVESLNRDKGYDRMILEMLAGDELAPTDPATFRATGFLARNWYLFNRNVWLENTVEHTSKAFLGITLNCARCHDHFFDPITQKEYFAFRAFFEPVEVRNDRVAGQPDVNQDSIPRVYDAHLGAPTYLFVRGEARNADRSKTLVPVVPAALGGGKIKVEAIKLPAAAIMPEKQDFFIRELVAASEKSVARARALGEQAKKDAARAKQTAEAYKELLKRFALRLNLSPAEHAAELAKVERLAKVSQEQARHAEIDVPLAEAKHAALLAMLRVERLEDAGVPQKSKAWQKAARQAATAQRRQAVLEAKRNQLLAQLAVEQAHFQAEQTANNAARHKEDKLLQTRARQATAALTAARTRLTTATQTVARAEQAAKQPPTTAYTRRVLPTYPATSTGRRLALARWIADKQNPLTARVAMNHIWLRHFGKALVPTVFDFGRNGQPPSHAALLDWLAAEFMRRDWSMKQMHRLIVTSSAYRMDSVNDGPSRALDPDNRWLWRMNSRRMEAELVRDSVLHVAGNLDATIGGPDLPHQLGLTPRRRSLYFQHAAEKQMEFLSLFDAANVTECYSRTESVVPQQALAMANSALVLAQSRLLARSLSKEVGAKPTPAANSAFVKAGFECVLGRLPTIPEQTACEDFLKSQAALLADKKKLTPFNAGPPGVVQPAADPHQRARESLIHVLMNHHEFVTIR